MMTNPNRPQHPDFFELVQVVLDMDAVSDNRTMPFVDHVGQIIDPPSLRYMAEQRAFLATNAHPALALSLSGTHQRDLQVVLSAMWMEAFVAGAHYQAKRDHTPGLPYIVGKQGEVVGEVGPPPLARFATEEDASEYIGIVAKRDPEGVESGAYYIDNMNEEG